MPDEAAHYLILCYDIQNSARLGNDDKLAARELLSDCRDAAIDAASITAESAQVKDLGDGALVLFGAQVPKLRVLGPWLDAFHGHLQRAFERAADGCQVRLAVHSGEVHSSLGDYSGADLDFVTRLVDAPIAKRVLTVTPSASLVVIVSDVVYHQVVRQGAPTLVPASYSAVRFSVKEADAAAWLHVPGWARVPLPPDAHASASSARTNQKSQDRRGISIGDNASIGVIGNGTTTGPFTFHSRTQG